MPLRNHSATMILSYHKASDSDGLKFQFLGQARQRWIVMRKYIEMWSQFGHSKLSDLKQNDLEIEFTIQSIEKVSQQAIANLVQDLANITFTVGQRLAWP